jgi:hypothetical protein
MTEAAPPQDRTPSAEEALLLAHDVLHPEDGGDHRPVKLASARSSRDTVELAAKIDAYAAQVSAERVKAERERCRLIRHILDVPVYKLDDANFLRACVLNARHQAELALKNEPLSAGERAFIAGFVRDGITAS